VIKVVEPHTYQLDCNIDLRDVVLIRELLLLRSEELQQLTNLRSARWCRGHGSETVKDTRCLTPRIGDFSKSQQRLWRQMMREEK
jgi:hypothetical protein